MQESVIVIGTGEMGGVFTRGLLRLGHPIFPVNRHTNLEKICQAVPEPRLVLVAVGENDLHSTLENVPKAWHAHLGLLQNELLPGDWKQHNISNPTVISVWFEKKKGQDFKVLVPSPIYGPQASLLENALATLEIPSWELDSEAELEYELVRKNVYILTTNIAGLVIGGTVDDLWYKHEDLARQIANEVMDIQAWLVGHHLELPVGKRDRLERAVLTGRILQHDTGLRGSRLRWRHRSCEGEANDCQISHKNHFLS